MSDKARCQPVISAEGTLTDTSPLFALVDAKSQLREYTIAMNHLAKHDEKVLDQSLRTLLATHGYPQVLAHLVQLARREQKPMPSARYLMTLTPEEREPFLAAAVSDALPLYEADSAKPEAERALTADLETGDFHDYETARD